MHYFHKVNKWQDRGYWISKQYYWQSMGYYLYNAIKYRSLTFFSACNPALSFGGMLADNKTEAYNIIPHRYLPKMMLFDANKDLHMQIEQEGLQFPVVIKPNMGYKGFAVRECRNILELSLYIEEMKGLDKEWLIQEYIDKRCEYSIMYHRLPETDLYGVTSISKKEYPTVIGDGVNNIYELIKGFGNAFIDKNHLYKKWESKRNDIPSKGEKVVLHHIGNYSRGSKFYSQMGEIDSSISKAMYEVFDSTEEIYYCRFDIKADSLDEVRKGNFMIMEINGAKSEPLHIYDPQYTFWNRVKDIREHWKLMTTIVDARRALKNYQFPGNMDGLRSVRQAKRGVK